MKLVCKAKMVSELIIDESQLLGIHTCTISYTVYMFNFIHCIQSYIQGVTIP